MIIVYLLSLFGDGNMFYAADDDDGKWINKPPCDEVQRDLTTDGSESTASVPETGSWCHSMVAMMPTHLCRCFGWVVHTVGKQPSSWPSIVFNMVLMVCSMFIYNIVAFFFPLPPVEDGFPWHFHFILLPTILASNLFLWSYAVSFLFPHGYFMKRARFGVPAAAMIITLFGHLLLISGRGYWAIAFWVDTSSWEVPNPLPYSIFQTMPTGMLLTILIPAMPYMHVDRWSTRYKSAATVFFLLFVFSVIVFLWGIGMHRLKGNNWAQLFVGGLLVIIKFIFKTFVMSSLVYKAVPEKFIVAGYAVDIIIARVLAATTPFFKSPLAFLASLVIGHALTHSFRLYIGPDRVTIFFQVFFCGCRRWGNNAESLWEQKRKLRILKGQKITDPLHLFRASIKDICKVSLRSQKKIKYHRVNWYNRALYHYVESTGSVAIALVVRLQHIMCVWVARNIKVKDHLHERFYLDDDKWDDALGYAWGAVLFLIVWLWLVDRYFFPNLKYVKDDEPLRMRNVLGFIFFKDDNFKFFAAWFLVTGSLLVASMVEHFGFDYDF